MAEITLKIHINSITEFNIGDYITLNDKIIGVVVELKALPTEL